MPRTRINANGIAIAKPGFDVDTAAPADMVFSPSYVALRLALSGTAAVTTFHDSNYNRTTVSFPAAFAVPPIVMVAGILGGGQSDQSAIYVQTAPVTPPGIAGRFPYYQIETATTHFTLMVHVRAATHNWRYWVFHNTIN